MMLRASNHKSNEPAKKTFSLDILRLLLSCLEKMRDFFRLFARKEDRDDFPLIHNGISNWRKRPSEKHGSNDCDCIYFLLKSSLRLKLHFA